MREENKILVPCGREGTTYLSVNPFPEVPKAFIKLHVCDLHAAIIKQYVETKDY
jgi:hypothetical protein